MSHTPERLSDSRYVFLTLWFLLNASDELVHGEVRDSDDRLRGRFRTWDELAGLVRSTVIGPSPAQ